MCIFVWGKTARTNSFACCNPMENSTDIRCQMKDMTPKYSTMQIHIGSLIREELRRQGHNNAWLAERIGLTPRALQKIFNKQSIDTHQLLLICTALQTDLFKHYSQSLSIQQHPDAKGSDSPE